MSNSGETQAEASTASPAWVGQLRAPERLDFEADDLPLRWKRWKEEITLYMDLAMAGETSGRNLRAKSSQILVFQVGYT